MCIRIQHPSTSAWIYCVLIRTNIIIRTRKHSSSSLSILCFQQMSLTSCYRTHGKSCSRFIPASLSQWLCRCATFKRSQSEAILHGLTVNIGNLYAPQWWVKWRFTFPAALRLALLLFRFLSQPVVHIYVCVCVMLVTRLHASLYKAISISLFMDQ